MAWYMVKHWDNFTIRDMGCILLATYSSAAQTQHWNWRILFLYTRPVLNTYCGSYCVEVAARSGVRSVISEQRKMNIKNARKFSLLMPLKHATENKFKTRH
jgi:hypothetical protein